MMGRLSFSFLRSAWHALVDVRAARDALLVNRSPALRRRRLLAGVAALAAVDAVLVGLRQSGVLRKLPDLPGRVWDSNAVVTSRAAYVLGVPDAAAGSVLFTAIMALAVAGADRPIKARPLLATALAGTTGAAAVGAGLYLYDMLFRERKLCPWCLTAASASVVMLAIVIGELTRRPT